ncbi:MAG: polysaccharide deacetylase family protein [Desulfobulbaceae bacterium]|nr:polysaccharide deacetylase family protein [Desulfobulbaceae bacterium]
MLRRIYRCGRSLVHRMANRIDTPVLVLLYHRVTTLESDPYLLAVTSAHFRAQMEYLRENFPVLRFGEEWAHLSKPGVVVTFDDGYADNLLEAVPILEEVGVPATFFVATGPIAASKGFWWDELESILLVEREFPAHFRLEDNEYGREWPTATYSELQMLHRDILILMKKIDYRCREEWLLQLRRWVGKDNSTRISHRTMTVDELQRLAKSPMATIGAHGETHSAFSAIPPTQQKEELVTSKNKLESWLDQKISVFSYPYGDRASYNRTSVRLCREVGFSKAAANFLGQAHRWTDAYQIPRQMILNWSVQTFSKKIEEFLVR